MTTLERWLRNELKAEIRSFQTGINWILNLKIIPRQLPGKTFNINERNQMNDQQTAAFQAAVELLGLPVGTVVTVSYPPVAPAPVVTEFTVV